MVVWSVIPRIWAQLKQKYVSVILIRTLFSEGCWWPAGGRWFTHMRFCTGLSPPTSHSDGARSASLWGQYTNNNNIRNFRYLVYVIDFHQFHGRPIWFFSCFFKSQLAWSVCRKYYADCCVEGPVLYHVNGDREESSRTRGTVQGDSGTFLYIETVSWSQSTMWVSVTRTDGLHPEEAPNRPARHL